MIVMLMLSVPAMAKVQDKRIADGVADFKKMNYEFCLSDFPKDYCKDVAKAFDKMIELVSVDGQVQGLQMAKKRIKK